jgi:hypothetical protein
MDDMNRGLAGSARCGSGYNAVTATATRVPSRCNLLVDICKYIA